MRLYALERICFSVLFGSLIMIASFPVHAQDEPVPAPALALQESFVQVADEVGPAVVSISVEQIQQVQMYAMSPFGSGSIYDDFLQEFFREFMQGPQDRQYKRMGLGTGVIIDEKGYILTNEHVVANADRITVTLPDGRDFVGSVVGTDQRSDLAVIQIDADDLPVARLGNSDAVRIGEWAIAVGNPFGFAAVNPEPTITTGVISALNRELPRTQARDRDYTDLIQTDAAINPGNSGGPLVNIHGEVIGINVAILTTSGGYEGIGFAIPINVAKFVLDDLVHGRTVLYGWLGVNIQDMNQALADYFDLPDTRGVVVTRVVPYSPAAQAGVQLGDIITEFNGNILKDPKDLVKMVSRTKVNTEVALGIIRKGMTQELKVTIGERPGQKGTLQATPPPAMQAELKGPWRGLYVQGITSEIAQHLGLTTETGVIVTEVIAGSPADQAGLRPGDVIKEIEQQEIPDIETYIKIVKKLSGIALVRTDRGYVVVQPE